MAFRLKRRNHVARQMGRVVARELASAVDALRPPADEARPAGPGAFSAEAVHTARKHLKKARAVLRLLEERFGRDFDRLNRPLREAARRLSDVRDADANIETFEKLRGRYPRVLASAIAASVARALEAHRLRARSRVANLLPVVVRTLRASARIVPPRVRRAASAGAARDGMGRSYRRARKAMASANAQGGDDAFHRWRRRVKDHWYQMRLLEGLDGHTEPRVRALKRLERWLGDHHNLVVLRDLIQRRPSRFGSGRAVAAVLGCIDRRKAALGRRLARRGARLFAPRPARFRAQIDRWWKA